MGRRGIEGLIAVAAALMLMLGAVSQDAWAQACPRGDSGCVGPGDVKKKALTDDRRKDEAGLDFIAQPDTQQEIGFGAPKVYGTVGVQVPDIGTVIVNASITLEALENPSTASGVRHGRGTMECAITTGGNVIEVNNRNRTFGSVDWDDGFVYETLFMTRGFTIVPARPSTYALVCRFVPGSAGGGDETLLRARGPSITATYYPNLNQN